MKLRWTAALLVLHAAAAAAQDTPVAKAVEEKDPAVLEMRERMADDPAAAEAVALRLARSRVIGLVASDGEESNRMAAARDWVAKDPDSAARIALGLARDDERGKPAFENALLRQMSLATVANPGAEKNLFNRLRRTAAQSKLVKQQADGDRMSEDQRRELLRALFEGQGARAGALINKKEGDEKGPGDKAAPATSFSGYYDRLSAANLHGYSPQLLAFQSALNARRPPGAPPLIETGKLDYPTLAYPSYAMSYDVGNLEERLRRERILASAALSGRTLSDADWRDPSLESTLAAKVPAGKLPARLRRRAELAAKARSALSAFSAAAQRSKDPAAITRGLLLELSRRQKDAARWIAAAALEEELSRVDAWGNFLTPELLAAVDAAPASADERAAYKRRGAALKADVDAVKANAERALDLLQSDAWEKSLAAVDRLVAQNQALKRTLGRDIDDYARVPFLIAQARMVQPRWREWLDDAAVKWAPGLDYSRGVASRRGALSRALDDFARIAAAGRP